LDLLNAVLCRALLCHYLYRLSMILTDLHYMHNIYDLIQVLLTVNYTEKELEMSIEPIILPLSFMLSSILTYVLYVILCIVCYNIV